MESMDQECIGIDFGTDFCRASYFNGQTVESVRFEGGRPAIETAIGFGDSSIVVGKEAIEKDGISGWTVIRGFKRVVGKKFKDPGIQGLMNKLPISKTSGTNNAAVFDVQFKNSKMEVYPELLVAILIDRIVKVAEKQTGYKINRAVVSVPSISTSQDRKAIINAGHIAKISIVRVISEISAAFQGSCWRIKSNNEVNFLIVEFGASSLQVAVAILDDGIMEMMSLTGDGTFGGHDIDFLFARHCWKVFANKNQRSEEKIPSLAMKTLCKVCESAKIALSSQEEAVISITDLIDGIPFEMNLTRTDFENLIKPSFLKVTELIDQALEMAFKTKDVINNILMFGGTTKIPLLRSVLEDYFTGCSPKLEKAASGCVAEGLAVSAAVLSDSSSNLISHLLFLDLNPLSVGIEIAGGLMHKLIGFSNTVPCVKTQTFSTYKDNQGEIYLNVYQGECKYTSNNTFLGKFELRGVRPAPRGVPQIEIKFDLDSNCILNVTALDKTGGGGAQISVVWDYANLTNSDIEKQIEWLVKNNDIIKPVN